MTSVLRLHVFAALFFVVVLILLLLWPVVTTASAQELKNAPCLKHISNLHPSHPAAPPLDAMALAISVGDTRDTEGRAD